MTFDLLKFKKYTLQNKRIRNKIWENVIEWMPFFGVQGRWMNIIARSAVKILGYTFLST